MKTAVSWLACALLLGACGSATSQATSASDLPAFTASDALMFDDGLSPGAMGIEVGNVHGSQRQLDALTRSSDVVARVKVSTVNEELSGEGKRFHLVFTPTGESLSGPPLTQSVDVYVAGDNPTATYLSSLGSSLAGRTIIVFLKQFAGAEGTVAHFHGEADARPVLESVRRAAALAEF